MYLVVFQSLVKCKIILSNRQQVAVVPVSIKSPYLLYSIVLFYYTIRLFALSPVRIFELCYVRCVLLTHTVKLLTISILIIYNTTHESLNLLLYIILFNLNTLCIATCTAVKTLVARQQTSDIYLYFCCTVNHNISQSVLFIEKPSLCT